MQIVHILTSSRTFVNMLLFRPGRSLVWFEPQFRFRRRLFPVDAATVIFVKESADTILLWFHMGDEDVHKWADFLLVVPLTVPVHSMCSILAYLICHRRRICAFVVPMHS